MALDYKLNSTNRAGRPRSKRLRETGVAGTAGGSTVVTVNSSGNNGTALNHTHANKNALDQITTDSNGYEWLTRNVEVQNEEGEIEVQTVTEKVKAGFADVARDLTEDSPVRQEFLSRLADDVAKGNITFEKGLQTGKTFIDGPTGKGGKIDEAGNAWLESLQIRRFLEVPELRYNRISMQVGNSWRAPGGGIIERVVPDHDDDGQVLNTGTVYLHLEEGEPGLVAENDICMGIYHDGITKQTNALADSDDGIGNFKFKGFFTTYFRVTEVIGSDNSAFKYAIRPKSETWQETHHPREAMHFVAYGNFTDRTRQTSRYSTRTYERYLKDVANWEFTGDNIGAQFGDLGNLKLFGMDMTGYSAYLNNIYMNGKLAQFTKLPLRVEIDTEGSTILARGETLHLRCSVWRGYIEDVTAQVTGWEITRDSGDENADGEWQLKEKVMNFDGNFDIEADDLGTGANTLFTVAATLADGSRAFYSTGI